MNLLGLIVFLCLVIVFLNILTLLTSMDYFTMTFGMGEADYWALIFGGISILVLGIVYYYLFNNVMKDLKTIFEKEGKETSRYY